MREKEYKEFEKRFMMIVKDCQVGTKRSLKDKNPEDFDSFRLHSDHYAGIDMYYNKEKLEQNKEKMRELLKIVPIKKISVRKNV